MKIFTCSSLSAYSAALIRALLLLLRPSLLTPCFRKVLSTRRGGHCNMVQKKKRTHYLFLAQYRKRTIRLCLEISPNWMWLSVFHPQIASLETSKASHGSPLGQLDETGTTVVCTKLDSLNGVAGSKSMDKALSGDRGQAESPWDLESNTSIPLLSSPTNYICTHR